MIRDWLKQLKKPIGSELTKVLVLDGEEIVSMVHHNLPDYGGVLISYDQHVSVCEEAGKNPMPLDTWNRIRFGHSGSIPDGAW